MPISPGQAVLWACDVTVLGLHEPPKPLERNTIYKQKKRLMGRNGPAAPVTPRAPAQPRPAPAHTLTLAACTLCYRQRQRKIGQKCSPSHLLSCKHFGKPQTAPQSVPGASHYMAGQGCRVWEMKECKIGGGWADIIGPSL